MAKQRYWTDQRNQRLAAAYKAGGIDEAVRQFPDKTRGALMQQATVMSITLRPKARKPRSAEPLKRKVATTDPTTKRARNGGAKVNASSSTSDQRAYRLGPVDRGELEQIRKALNYETMRLSKMLGRTPAAIREALRKIVEGDFKPDSRSRISVDPADAYPSTTAGRVCHEVARVRFT